MVNRVLTQAGTQAECREERERGDSTGEPHRVLGWQSAPACFAYELRSCGPRPACQPAVAVSACCKPRLT